MKKTLLSFVILTASLQGLKAQKAAQAVFAELGGPGLFSINYDTRFQKKEDGIGGKVGVGYFKIDDESTLTIPVAVNYILGKDQRNYFEVGAGFTYVSYKSDYNNNDDNFSSSFGHLNLGYRLAPRNGGFFFRAAITPVFGKGFFVPYWAGVSFGYKF